MKSLLGLFFALLMTLAVEAAEIVGWKVPLSSYAFRGLDSDGIVRLQTPPEASPFFRQGDELWDLARIPPDDSGTGIESLEPTRLKLATDPPLQWAVWNASSRQLVTKGDWNSIWQLHQHLRIDQLPRQFRLVLEVFEIPANGLTQANNAVPTTSLNWLTRSGNKFVASKFIDKTGINVKGDLAGNDGMIDLTMHVSCTVRDLPKLNFDSALVLSPGQPCLVARDFSGGNGLDVRITGRIELLDGTPLDQAVVVQRGDLSETLAANTSEPRRHRVGNGWLMTAWLDPARVANFTPTGHDSSNAMDPFAVQPPEVTREMLKLNAVIVPASIRTWFPDRVWDLSVHIRNQGINGDFAGYDPWTQRVFLLSGIELEIDRFEQLISPGCNRSPAMVQVTLDGESQSMLVTRSGQKSTLSRSVEGKIVRSMDLEPTIGESDEIIDLRLEYLDDSQAGRKQEAQNSMTLRPGLPSVILGGPDGGDGSKPLQATAEIQRVLIE